ncbi:MAG: histidine kinase dimerization/phospho-acceptor domain-containing protein [Gemmatimonadota bacterium]|jgi:signal transduction histidine kinase
MTQDLHMTANADGLEAAAELVRQVRHDANNPLTAALGHVQLILENPAMPDDELRASLRIVEGELLRLVDILRRLRGVKLPASSEPTPPGA